MDSFRKSRCVSAMIVIVIGVMNSNGRRGLFSTDVGEQWSSGIFSSSPGDFPLGSREEDDGPQRRTLPRPRHKMRALVDPRKRHVEREAPTDGSTSN